MSLLGESREQTAYPPCRGDGIAFLPGLLVKAASSLSLAIKQVFLVSSSQTKAKRKAERPVLRPGTPETIPKATSQLASTVSNSG